MPSSLHDRVIILQCSDKFEKLWNLVESYGWYCPFWFDVMWSPRRFSKTKVEFLYYNLIKTIFVATFFQMKNLTSLI